MPSRLAPGAQHLEDRLPRAVQRRFGDRRQVVAGLVPAREREVDQVDRWDPPAHERRVVVGDLADETGREGLRGTDLLRGGAQAAPYARVGTRLARDPHLPL